MITPEYLLLGNITADIAPGSRLLGGTVSYSAPTAAAFGLCVGLVTSAATEEPLLSQLEPVATICAKPAAETTTFENIYTSEGRVQYIRGVASPIVEADIPKAWHSAPLVHLGPIAAETDPSLARLFPQSTVLLTLQGCLREWGADGRVNFRRWFDADLIDDLDIIVFSEEDILAAPELEADIAAVARCLVVTRAERGGTVYLNGVRYEYPTPQVELIHPTGAGDIFAASLLASLRPLGGDVLLACRAAARLAAISVTRIGVEGVPTPDEVRAAVAAEMPISS
jgi:sugar/nucleoside kinase (ribokinase family)